MLYEPSFLGIGKAKFLYMVVKLCGCLVLLKHCEQKRFHLDS